MTTVLSALSALTAGRMPALPEHVVEPHMRLRKPSETVKIAVEFVEES
jgi:hypothetical protein